MALKKQKSREVFEEILKHLKIALADPAFVEENSELDISIEKLRNKYNLKKSWRGIVDRAKVGSSLHVEREPKYSFKIVHVVLNNTNSSLVRLFHI